jgi:tryptophan-rich sensory protein
MKYRPTYPSFNDIVFWETILVVFAIGYISSSFIAYGLSYYQNLQPNWAPPEYTVPMVWVSLYFLIAVTLYDLSLSDPKKNVFMCLGVLSIILQLVWSYFFYVLHNLVVSLALLTVLVCTIITEIAYGWFYNHLSSGLLIIYLFWVSYLLFVNAYLISQENKKLLKPSTSSN